MKTKHTKGEWFANVISTITIGVNAVIQKDDNGVYSQNVCEFIIPETDEEYEKERQEIEANAKLIAAAPEMLKEHLIDLEHLKKWKNKLIDAGLRGSEMYQEYKDMIDAKERVIKKATE